jgi:dTMP kinase
VTDRDDYRPAYLVFEGMDGSGKSTLSKAVTEQLPWRTTPLHLCFPSKDGAVGQLIRRAFVREVSFGSPDYPMIAGHVFGYLMVADALDREPVVLDALRLEKRPVIADRHPTVSGWVYQRETMKLDTLIAMQQRQLFTVPIVTYVLDVPAEVAIERMQQRGEIRNSIFEQDGVAYVRRLRGRYLAYATMHPDVVVLDATKSIEELLAEVKEHLNGHTNEFKVFA